MEDQFEKHKSSKNWYYVIIQNADTSAEQYVGFSDGKTQEKFIPAFKSKEHAQECFTLMPKDLFNGNYDTHAVIDDDLMAVAEEHGHKIYLLDEKGNILEFLN